MAGLSARLPSAPVHLKSGWAREYVLHFVGWEVCAALWCASLSCTQLSTKLWGCSCWLLWPLSLAVTPWACWEAPGFWENKGVGQEEKWAGRAEIDEKLPVIHRQLSTLHHMAELVLQRVSSWCYGWLNATRNCAGKWVFYDYEVEHAKL